jgi:hypothetical protein
MFPIKAEAKSANKGFGEIRVSIGFLELVVAGEVEEEEAEMELLGELGDDVIAAVNESAGVSIDAFEILEVVGSGGAADDAKTGAGRDFAIGRYLEAAIVIPDGFFVIGLSGEEGRGGPEQ